MTSVGRSLRVGENPHHFVEADGKPFFWMGDTAWPLFVYYSPDEVERYLTDRARRGFNVILTSFVLGVSNQIDSFRGDAPSPNLAGHSPWGASPSQPSEAYFDHAEGILDRAAALGLHVAVAPTWGYSVTDLRLFDPSSAESYGRWLGQRFRDQPNIIWVNGCDREPIGQEATFDALARGLRAGDDGSHLITYHPSGARSSSQFWHDADWLDFNMIQTWSQWFHVYQMVAADYGLSPTRPIVLGEGAYEDGQEYPTGPITPLIVRRQAWWSWMAGGFTTYGQNQMWRMEGNWLDCLDRPGTRDMTTFKDIVTSRAWWELIPDQSLFAFGESSGRTLNAAMRTLRGSCAMIYLSEATHVVLEMNRIASARAQATWVHPQTGESVDAGVHLTGNRIPGRTLPERVHQAFTTPPFWQDAVLILDAIDGESPADQDRG
jgi:hypothetical protein